MHIRDNQSDLLDGSIIAFWNQYQLLVEKREPKKLPIIDWLELPTTNEYETN